jgi:disulfide bond formation protein DsbB
MSSTSFDGSPPLARMAPVWLIVAPAALLSGALAFQYLGGLAPCVLCIWQRWAHVAAMALAVLALIAAATGRPRVAAGLTALSGVAFLAGAGIAGFHVGVEQRWWEGTPDCGSTLTATTVADLKAQLMNQPIVRCDEVPWEMLGISMAGYNLIASLGLSAFAFWSAAVRGGGARRAGAPA